MMSLIPTPAPEEDVPVISRPPTLEPRISLIPTPIPIGRVPVPTPGISLIQVSIPVEEEEVLFDAKPPLVKDKGKSISRKSSLRKKRDSFISKLKHLLTLEED